LNGNAPHVDDLLGAYVLDAVSTQEADLVAAHLRTCAECRLEMKELSQVVAVLPLALEQTEPSSELRGKLLAEASRDFQPPRGALVPLAGKGRERRSHSGLISASQAAVGLVAMAAVLALALWNVSLQNKVHDQQSNISALTVVTKAIASGARISPLHSTSASSSASAAFVQSASGAQAFIVVEGLKEPSAGKVYQLWLIRAKTPVSAGVFTVSSSGPQIWHLASPPHGRPTAALTLEPAPFGSAKPTTAPLLLGRLAA
jgi:anti-sigma factor RsiW